jgi:hypothetical protein
MVRPHDIDRRTWERAKREARAIMIATARSAKGTITYNELASRITGLRLEPDSLALRELLVEISLAERWSENPRAGQEGCPRETAIARENNLAEAKVILPSHEPNVANVAHKAAPPAARQASAIAPISRAKRLRSIMPAIAILLIMFVLTALRIAIVAF